MTECCSGSSLSAKMAQDYSAAALKTANDVEKQTKNSALQLLDTVPAPTGDGKGQSINIRA